MQLPVMPPLSPMLATGLGLAFVAVLFVFSSDYRFDRFTAFLDITGHRDELSYQTYQGFLAIADGGLTGSGVGAGNGKLGYLPLAHSDFIFAVVADELGLVGSIAVVGGFMLLVWYGIQAAWPRKWPSTAISAQVSSTSCTWARALRGCSPSELPTK